MIGRGLAGYGLFAIAALIPCLSGATPDGLKIEVERPRLVVDKAQYSILARLKLVFDAQFTNLANAPVEIPDRVSVVGVAGIFENGVESRQSDANWRIAYSGGDVMWIGEIAFPRCKSLDPKETLVVKGAWGPLVDSESNLDRLGTRATIRLYLVLPCKRRDAKVVSEIARTNAFVLSIPPLP